MANVVEDEKINWKATLSILLFTISTYMIMLALDGKIKHYWFLIGNVLLFVLGYFEFKKILSNVLVYFILLFLVLVVYPDLHFYLYTNDARNYSYEDEYLNYKSDDSKNGLREYKWIHNSNSLLKTLPDTFLNKKLSSTTVERLMFVNGYIAGIFHSNDLGPHQRPSPSSLCLIVYDKRGFKLFSEKIYNCKNIKDIFKRYNQKYQRLVTEINNPNESLMLYDFWMESSTGFIFGDIKPISPIAKFLRILQILTTAFLSFLIANSVRIPDVLKLNRREENL